jgi:putative peptidoglycan lipid II flippase
MVSVLINIFISIFYFDNFGFIIIPIATSISSWFNSIILFIFLKKNNLFNFNFLFLNRFLRILIATSIMGLFFNYLINFFGINMEYEQNFKAVYLVGIVFLALISYFLIAVLIKAFKINDIKLKY